MFVSCRSGQVRDATVHLLYATCLFPESRTKCIKTQNDAVLSILTLYPNRISGQGGLVIVSSESTCFASALDFEKRDAAVSPSDLRFLSPKNLTKFVFFSPGKYVAWTSQCFATKNPIQYFPCRKSEEIPRRNTVSCFEVQPAWSAE